MTRTYNRRSCKVCGAQFTPTGPKAYYCSPECQKTVTLPRARERENRKWRTDPEFKAAKLAQHRRWQRENRDQERPGWLYAVAEEGTNYIKLGQAAQEPETRLRAMQTGNPRTLYLLRSEWVEDRFYAECDLHRRFAEHRIRGEWFVNAGSLAEYLGQEADSGGQG